MKNEDLFDQRPKQAASGLDGFWAAEIGLCAIYLYLGFWEIKTGWESPPQVGWIQGGTVYMIGALACGWLAWFRRNTRRGALMHILLVAQLAELTQHGIEWWIGKGDAKWPLANSVFAALFLVLIVLEARSHRKAAAREADCETNHFNMDDTP